MKEGPTSEIRMIPDVGIHNTILFYIGVITAGQQLCISL